MITKEVFYILKKIIYNLLLLVGEINKEGIVMAKKNRDAGKIFVKVMASILALLMVLGIAGTLLFYLIAR